MNPPENTLLLSDAMDGIRSLPDQSIDLIVTDPPYDTLEKWRAIGTTTRLVKAWFPVVPPSYFKDFFVECFRVLKKDTNLFVFCDDETKYNIDPYIRAAGFNRRKALIWEKVGKEEEIQCPNCHRVVTTKFRPGSPGMGYPFRSCYEAIYFGQKGKRKAHTGSGDRSVRDVIPATQVNSRASYPTQKPTEVIEVLIRQSSDPGDLVLDPFAGGGSTLIAAHHTDRRFLGYDIQQASLDFFQAAFNRERGIVPEIVSHPEDCDILSMFGTSPPQKAEEYQEQFNAPLSMPIDAGAKLLAESQELLDRYKK